MVTTDILMIILLFFHRPISGQDIYFANVLGDGFLDPPKKPLGGDVKIDENWSRKALSICLWLHPFRFLASGTNILSLSSSSDDLSFISISIIENKIVLKLSHCAFSLDIEPPRREWTHFCFSSLSFSEFFVNGKPHVTYTSCYVDEILEEDVENIYVRIGYDYQVTTPFSGQLADVRLYFKALNLNEVRNISTVSFVPDEYKDILRILKDIKSEKPPPPKPKYYVDIYTVKEERILASYIPYVLMYIAEKGQYNHASKVCKIRQGYLPNFDTHGKDAIIAMIKDFIQSSESGVTFNNFWLNVTNSTHCKTGTYTPKPLDIQESDTACNNSAVNYFCVIEKNKSFRMIGFSENLIFYMFPVPYEIGAFETVDMYGAYFKNRHFHFKELITNTITFETRSIQTDQLVGRNKWFMVDDHTTEIITSLTACSDNEFTCTKGTCIDINMVCNMEDDCYDMSDETSHVCDISISPNDTYDCRISPKSTHGAPKLALNLSIQRIIDVNIKTNIVELYVKCEVKWKDPRLLFKFLPKNESGIISPSNTTLYWQPDIKVYGAIQDHKDNLSFKVKSGTMTAYTKIGGSLAFIKEYRARVYSGRNVLLTNEKTSSLNIVCNMDLFYFPFDKQNCTFTLYLKNELKSNMEWKLGNESITLGPKVVLTMYEIKKFYSVLRNPQKIDITMILERKFGAYIFNTILPCIVLETIGLLTNLLPIDDYGDRVSVTLSCLIVMASLFTQVSTMLPESAGPKLIDIWMFAHVAVLLLVFSGHVLVVILHDRMIKQRRSLLERNGINELTIFKSYAEKLNFKDKVYITSPVEIKSAWKNNENYNSNNISNSKSNNNNSKDNNNKNSDDSNHTNINSINNSKCGFCFLNVKEVNTFCSIASCLSYALFLILFYFAAAKVL